MQAVSNKEIDVDDEFDNSDQDEDDTDSFSTMGNESSKQQDGRRTRSKSQPKTTLVDSPRKTRERCFYKRDKKFSGR